MKFFLKNNGFTIKLVKRVLSTIKISIVKVQYTFMLSVIFVELNSKYPQNLKRGKKASYRNQIEHELLSYNKKKMRGRRVKNLKVQK